LKYAKGLKKYCGSVPGAVFEREEARQTHWNQKIAAMDGNENPHKLHDELGDIMAKNVTIVRHNKDLEATDKKLQELKARWHNIKILDNTAWANSELLFVRQLWHMLELARVITLGALARNESRGSHYKPEFPNRDDVNWLKTTKAEWTKDGPKLSYEPVDLKYLTPELRNYA